MVGAQAGQLSWIQCPPNLCDSHSIGRRLHAHLASSVGRVRGAPMRHDRATAIGATRRTEQSVMASKLSA